MLQDGCHEKASQKVLTNFSPLVSETLQGSASPQEALDVMIHRGGSHALQPCLLPEGEPILDCSSCQDHRRAVRRAKSTGLKSV